MSKYYYTGESTEDAINYFSLHDIKCDVVDRAFDMLYVWNKQGRQYIYWPTTGRWKGRFQKKDHAYSSKNVDDFTKRFLLGE